VPFAGAGLRALGELPDVVGVGVVEDGVVEDGVVEAGVLGVAVVGVDVGAVALARCGVGTTSYCATALPVAVIAVAAPIARNETRKIVAAFALITTCLP
jgi:hypothetical protein